MKFCIINTLISTCLVCSLQSLAQQNYVLELPASQKPLIRGHLDLGGVNQAGDSITVNNYYIEVKGKPFIPVIGEFHYARYPQQYWEESILKMKAGGINVLGTYIFWNVHERREGEFDWTGNLNLRKFVELCAKHGMNVIIRIGPFGHGEMRNGALPDWLYGRPFEVRSNDEGYLKYVRKLYAEISKQVSGKFYQNGGPIIGIQLENEYQHSAAPWEITYPGSPREFTVADRDIDVTHIQVAVSNQKNENAAYGEEHMNTLKRIANEVGMSAPIYTATGWGNAAIVKRGSIPVTAGYAYPFWTEPQPSAFYTYKDIHKNPDYSPVSYETDLYPSVPAELGSGILVTNYRRPTVLPQSIEPMIVRTLGSGSNGIGYYMYHGGSTPVFDHFYSEESSGLPKICYDFQAPIGEFGDTRDHYRSLRLLHMFLESFGDKLAPMQTVVPSTNPQDYKDVKTLRYAVRSSGNSGFVFMHNFQDHVDFKDIEGVQLKVKAASETILFPEKGTFTLKKEISAILPFNFDLDGVLLKSATVQPLTKLTTDGKTHFVFFSSEGLPATLVFAKDTKISTDNCAVLKTATATIVQGADKTVFSFSVGGKKILVVPRSMAVLATRVNDHLYFSNAALLRNGKNLEVISRGIEQPYLNIYPVISHSWKIDGAEIFKIKSSSKSLASFIIKFKSVNPDVKFEKISNRKYALKAGVSLYGLNDIVIRLKYKGDRSMAFFDGLLVADHFYYGKPWEIGLKRFIPKLQTQDMIFIFHPMQKDAGYLVDFEPSEKPDFGNAKSVLEFEKFEIIPEYKAIMTTN